jgi:hypothetical protein
MKEIYYTYNNEAIASCVILSVLNEINTLDVARSCLILPFLLDDRTVNYLQRNQDFELTLEQFTKDQSRLFVTFNKRYLALLPISINSLILLSKSNHIDIGKEISLNSTISLNNVDLGARFKKIKEVLPSFSSMIEKHTTIQLYKILKIQL